MADDGFYSAGELANLGFKSFGNNVFISRKCSIYGASGISVGNNVRIDDFSVLSGNITVGDYVHISAYAALYGKNGIRIGNFCGVSPRSTVFSATDDFSGEWMVSPMVPQRLTNVSGGTVVFEDFVQIGANTTVMPAVTLKEGAVTGACSLVLKDLDEWTINFGVPCKFYRERKRRAKELSLRV